MVNLHASPRGGIAPPTLLIHGLKQTLHIFEVLLFLNRGIYQTAGLLLGVPEAQQHRKALTHHIQFDRSGSGVIACRKERKFRHFPSEFSYDPFSRCRSDSRKTGETLDVLLFYRGGNLADRSHHRSQRLFYTDPIYRTKEVEKILFPPR